MYVYRPVRSATLAFAALIASALGSAPAFAAAHFVQLKDLYPGTSDGTTSYLSGTDEFVLFWGKDPSHLLGDPYGSDGTSANTGLISDVMGSSGNFFPGHSRMQLNGKVYFWFDDGIHGEQLWSSDGSAAGTVPLTTLTGMAADAAGIYTVVKFGQRVWFTARCPSSTSRCYYSTDGSAAGTHQELTTKFGDRMLLPMDTSLFFRDNFATLFVTDGTTGGTTSLGTILGSPAEPTAVNNRVYFGTSDASAGSELWTSDGSVAGTKRVADINPGTANSTPAMLTRVDDRIFFVALAPTTGRELWVSDSTGPGTVPVKDIRVGIQDSGIVSPAAINGKLFFLADDGVHGIEPWISDGTDAGTFMLVDTKLGSTGGAVTFSQAYSTGKLVFFTASDGASNNVLWSTDGTIAGTHIVDTVVNVDSGSLTTSKGKLFGSGQRLTGTYDGREPYVFNLLDYDRPAPGYSRMCTTVERGMPDNTTFTSTMVLPPYASITDLNVSVDLGHTYVGDLRLSLTHVETTTKVNLMLQSSCAGQLIDIVFDDAAATTANAACTNTRPAFPRDGVYKPSEVLSAFNGQSVAGHWTLTVADIAEDDVGTLHNWCMVFSTDRIFADTFE